MTAIIDPPSPYADLAKWQQFIEELETLPGGDEDVADALAQARSRIAELEAALPPSAA
jgi:hypothetical protein